MASHYPGFSTYQPTLLMIATWVDVGYYNSSKDLTNTFQTVLVTDGVNSFVIFLYFKLQWTQPDPKPPADYSVRYVQCKFPMDLVGLRLVNRKLRIRLRAMDEALELVVGLYRGLRVGIWKRLGLGVGIWKRLGLGVGIWKRLGLGVGIWKRLGLGVGIWKRLGLGVGIWKRLGLGVGIWKRLGLGVGIWKRLGLGVGIWKRLGLGVGIWKRG